MAEPSASESPAAALEESPQPPAGERPRRGAELELEIGSLAYGGEGVARTGASGYVVFVAGALPGDRVRAQVYKSKRAYAHARTLELLRPSAERIPPRADHPGVPWQVLPYERQLEVKAEQVDEALRRIGGLERFALEEIVPAREQWRYRNKLEFSFGHDADGALVCGFHAPARWNRVESMEDCLLASERVNRARRIALGWAQQEGLRAWERAVRPHRRQAANEDAPAQTRPSRGAHRAGAGWPRAAAKPRGARGAADGHAAGASGEHRGRAGRGRARARAARGTRRGEPGRRALESLAAARRDHRGGRDRARLGRAELAERICELDGASRRKRSSRPTPRWPRCSTGSPPATPRSRAGSASTISTAGIGTIALSLARRAGEVWGAEISEQAVEGARASAERNGVNNARFFAGDVRLAVRDWSSASVARTSSCGPAARGPAARRSWRVLGRRRGGSSTSPATRPRSPPTRRCS